MTIFDYKYLYSAYADHTTFFLKDIIFVKHMVDTFFSYFSGLKPNLTKSEIAGIGVLKGFKWFKGSRMWYALYTSEYRYAKNIRYPFLLK